jgi:hypothetical protein
VIHALTTCFLDDIVHFSTEIGHIMKSGRLARRLAATAGMGAIIAMGTLTACGQGEEAPETTTPTTTTTTSTTTAPPAPPVAPTEKSINPTGGNLFTPPVKAPPAPTGIPGDH